MKLRFLLVLIVFFLFEEFAYATITVTTATGGTNISADKAANASSPAYTTLGNIVLAEGANGDFPTSLTSFIINAPTGWEFNTSGVSTTVTGGSGFQNLSVTNISYSSTSITFTTSVGGTNKHDVLTIIGIQVRATNGASLPSSASITWGSAWLDPLWTGYPLGNLSQESGQVQNFVVEGEWGGNIGTQNALTPFNIRITARDQFNNTCSSGSNAFTGTATITSTGNLTAGGTTAAFSAGVITHSVTISNGGTFTITATNGSATGISNSFLVNNPPPTVTLSIDNTSIAENGGVATITVTLSNTYSQDVGVSLTPSGTAGGGDYTLSSYYVTITSGNLTGTSTITGTDDTDIDPGETVIVDITGVNNGTEDGTQQVTTTIIDDENPPPTVTLSIDNSTIAENGGVATITITLSNTFASTVGVNLDPTGGTAGGGDYNLSAYYVGIPSGNLTGTSILTGVDDASSDPGETVVVFITTVSNGTEDGVQEVTTTIIDDDTPGITVAPTSGLITTEDGGTDEFDIVLNTLPTDDVTITLYSNDTGEGTISPGSVTFTDLDWDTPQTITITGVADLIVDGDASYTVVTNAATSTDTDYDGLNPNDVSVTNTDNGIEPLVSFSSASGSAGESTASLVVTVELNVVLGVDVTVPFSINGSSTATGGGTDYSYSPNTPDEVVITAGNTSADITISIDDDALDENNETVIVDMGTPANASQGAITQHTATITDDDPMPTVIYSSSSQASANESGTMTITAVLSTASGLDVTVPFSVNGSSTATGGGTDYSITSSPLTITAGNTSSDITVSIVTDADIEGDETVVVDMGTPTNATQGATTTHTATITDDDFGSQTLAVSSNNICIGTQITLTATVSGPVNCSNIDYYEYSTDGGTNWDDVLNPAGTCSTNDTPASAGTYLYRYYYYKNGSNNGYSNTVSVTVNALPTPSFIAEPGANACVGVDVTYTTEASMSSYVWTFPGVLNTDYSITSGGTGTDNTVTLKYLTTGSKTVTINYTNGDGCTATSATSSTATTVAAPPSASLAVSDATSCNPAAGNVTITITNAESGVDYELKTTGGASLSPAVTGTGTGADLDLTILQANVPTSTTTYKVVATGTGGCSDVDLTDQPTVTVYISPTITNPGNQSSCGDYTLPVITGSDLTGSEAYWTATGGTGTTYSSGTAITSSVSPLYIYDVNNGCSAEETFNITINRLNLVVSDNSADISPDCPDLDNGFNPDNSNYNAGLSQISFKVERQLSSNFNWTFDFNLSGNDLIIDSYSFSGDDVTDPMLTSGTGQTGSINAGNNNYVIFMYDVYNVPGTVLNIDFTISNANDGACSGESEPGSSSDDTYTHIIEAMPVVGSFN